MNSNTKQVRETLETRKRELSDLSDQEKGINVHLESITAERTKAIKAFAAGDESRQKEISQLDEQIKPLALQLEGLQALIADAEVKVTEAQELLKKIED